MPIIKLFFSLFTFNKLLHIEKNCIHCVTDLHHKHARTQKMLELMMIIVSFLLSSIYIRRKYWIRENFRLPVFDGFTCFEMS